MAGWIEMPFGREIGLGPGHIVVDGDPAHPPQKGSTVSQFFAHVYCGQTAGWIKMPLGLEVGFGPGHIVLDGDPAPPKKGHSSHFSARVYCCQTAGWIKMPLCTKVGLIVLHGNPSSPIRGTTPPPVFGSCLLWPNGR